MTKEQIRQIENYNEQKRIRNLREFGSDKLATLIFLLLDNGAGVHWLLDEVNTTIEIWQDHQESEEE